MSDQRPNPTPAAREHRDGLQQAGTRVAQNTSFRAGAEALGKLASFVLFAALARAAGEVELGVFVFALAWLQVATVPPGIGLDGYFVRSVAKDPSRAADLFDVLSIKLLLSVPILVASFGLLVLLGYDSHTQVVVFLLAPGVLMDLLVRSFHSVFNALELGKLFAGAIVAQRVATAGVGVAALAAGYGVEVVAATYTGGVALGLLLSTVMLKRAVGLPPLSLTRRRWRLLLRRSLGFGAQASFTLLLSRVDTILLSLLAASAAVGRYGAASRLVEATLAISVAISGAFIAMYAYLNADTTPTLKGVFQRSIKLCVGVLVPIAVLTGFLAEPIAGAAFGAEFKDAADPLRLLAPTIVLVGVVFLSGSLIVSRRNPVKLAAITAGFVAGNVLLNVLLIPRYADAGAAAAMVVTQAVAGVVVLAYASRVVGGVRWGSMLGAPLSAGVAMSVPLILMQTSPAVAAVVAIGVYGAAFFGVERRVDPADLRFIVELLRQRLPARLRLGGAR